MDEVVEQAVVALVVSAVGALAFIAYKHPKGFEKIIGKLWFAGFAIYVIGSVWNVALLQSAEAVKGLQLDKSTTDRIIAALPDFIPWWWHLIYVAVMIYLAILWSLPYWLLDAEPPKNPVTDFHKRSPPPRRKQTSLPQEDLPAGG